VGYHGDIMGVISPKERALMMFGPPEKMILAYNPTYNNM
jgi:hypothetical protein